MSVEIPGPAPQESFYEQEQAVQVLAVTDLGPNDEGSISNEHLSEEAKQDVINAVTNPEYRRVPTNRWRCVDGRIPEGGVQTPEGYSDLQLAGGLAVNETSVDVLTGEIEDTSVLSEVVARNTQTAIQMDKLCLFMATITCMQTNMA